MSANLKVFGPVLSLVLHDSILNVWRCAKEPGGCRFVTADRRGGTSPASPAGRGNPRQAGSRARFRPLSQVLFSNKWHSGEDGLGAFKQEKASKPSKRASRPAGSAGSGGAGTALAQPRGSKDSALQAAISSPR